MKQQEQLAVAARMEKLFFRMIQDKEYLHKPLMVTPALLRIARPFLKQHTGDVIFLDFVKNETLYLPKNLRFKKDVWIAHSVWRSGSTCMVNGNVNYMSVELRPVHDFKDIKGIRTFDNESWRSYMELRKSKNALLSKAGRLYNKEVEGDEEQHKRFLKVCSEAPSLSLFDLIDELEGVEIKCNKKNGGYTVEGDVLLHGPYAYTIPNNTTFKGDLTLCDTCHQPFPDSTKVEGKITVLSYF